MRTAGTCVLLLLAAAAGAAERARIPLGLDAYLPVPPDNQLTQQRVELGRQLFFDRRLSRDRSISCASCHDPRRAFSTPQPVVTGVFGRRGTRNAPAIINRAYGERFFWDGHARTLEEQVVQPIQNPLEMDLTLEEAAARVGLDEAEITRALASYVRSILSGDSPFDRYVEGDVDALSAEQKKGLQVFRGKGNCSRCHFLPLLSDEELHNTGVAWKDGVFADIGDGKGAFKTPTLREVAFTAPYMHDGSLATLEQVIDYYDRGGNANPGLDVQLRPLQLTDTEKQDLVAFLRALSGKIQEGL